MPVIVRKSQAVDEEESIHVGSRREGYRTCQLFLHLEHVLLVVIRYADSSGETLVDTVCEALDHHGDGLGVDVAMNDVDVDVVNFEVVA